MKNIKKILFFILSFGFLMTGLVYGQDDDVLEYTYGEVIKILPNQIILSEYDIENEKEFENTYFFDSNLKITGVKSINDIAERDYIEIEFILKNGTKKIINLYVEKIDSDAFNSEESDDLTY